MQNEKEYLKNEQSTIEYFIPEFKEPIPWGFLAKAYKERPDDVTATILKLERRLQEDEITREIYEERAYRHFDQLAIVLQAIQKETLSNEAREVVENVWLKYNTRIQDVVDSNVLYEGLGTKLIMMEIRPGRATNRDRVRADQYEYPPEEVDAYTATLRALGPHMPGTTEVIDNFGLVQLLEDSGNTSKLNNIESWPDKEFPPGAFTVDDPLKRVVLETKIPNIRIAIEKGIDPRYPDINILCTFEETDFPPLNKVTIIPPSSANNKWRFSPTAFYDLVGEYTRTFREEQKSKVEEQQVQYLANNPIFADRQQETTFARLPTLQLRANFFNIIPPKPKDLKTLDSMLEASSLIEECLEILDKTMTGKGVNLYDFCHYTATRNILAMTPDEVIADGPALTEIMEYARKYSIEGSRLREIHTKINLAWDVPLTNQREQRFTQAVPPQPNR